MNIPSVNTAEMNGMLFTWKSYEEQDVGVNSDLSREIVLRKDLPF